MIDALVVSLVAPKPDPKAKQNEAKATEGKPQEGEQPKSNGRRRKQDAPEANGQPQSGEATPEAGVQEAAAPETTTPAPQDANGKEAEPTKKSRKAKE